MTKRRRRFKQTTSLYERLIAFSHQARERAASSLPAGHERQDLLKKARQADTATHLNEWINSPGLQPPK